MNEPQRVLIIKPSSLGDVVRTIPLLAAVKRAWAQARIDWLIHPAFVDLIAHHPALHQPILFERKQLSWAGLRPAATGKLLHLCRDLRQRHFDLVVDAQGLLRSGFLSYITGTAKRVGFSSAREGAARFYTHRVQTDASHATAQIVALAKHLNIDITPADHHIFVSNEDRSIVSEHLDGQPYAVLIAGARWQSKRWPAKRFCAIADRIQHIGLKAVFIGGRDATEMHAHLGGTEFVNLIEATTIGQMLAIVESAAIAIGNESGPIHAAEAMGKPIVVLMGPTDPAKVGPYRDIAGIVLPPEQFRRFHRDKSDQTQIRAIEVDPVWKKIEQQLALAASLPYPPLPSGGGC